MKNQKRKNYTKQERKAMIVTVLAIAIQNGEERWLTAYQISKRIGMTNCPSFRAMLTDLFDNKVIDKIGVHRRGKWAGWEYSLMPGTFQEPKKRTIALRVNGRDKAQLELF